MKTIFDRLEKKGAIYRQSSVGRTSIYAAKVTKESAQAKLVQDFIKKVFPKDKTPLFNTLIRDFSLSRDEIVYLEQLLDDKQKSQNAQFRSHHHEPCCKFNGAACWQDFYNCNILAEAQSPPPDGPFPGVFDSGSPDNPFADHSVIYLPYCDGSTFGGDNDVVDAGFPYGPARLLERVAPIFPGSRFTPDRMTGSSSSFIHKAASMKAFVTPLVSKPGS